MELPAYRDAACLCFPARAPESTAASARHSPAAAVYAAAYDAKRSGACDGRSGAPEGRDRIESDCPGGGAEALLDSALTASHNRLSLCALAGRSHHRGWLLARFPERRRDLISAFRRLGRSPESYESIVRASLGLAQRRVGYLG